MCEILFVIQLEPVRQVLLFDWFTTDHLVSGESTLHWITHFSARSRIFLPIAQSCAALFCCRLAIRASSLGWLVGNYGFDSRDDVNGPFGIMAMINNTVNHSEDSWDDFTNSPIVIIIIL